MPRMFVDRQHQPPRVTWQPMSLFCILLGGLLLIANAGCGSLLARFSDQSPPVFVPNPLDLPDAKADFVWSQVVDTVDDYFRVAREQPVQKANGVVLDGRLETSYQIGASILEPWRKDTTSGFERLQSTLQSIRRRADGVVSCREGVEYIMGRKILLSPRTLEKFFSFRLSIRTHNRHWCPG